MATDRFFLPDRFLSETLPKNFWRRKLLERNNDPKKAIMKQIVRATVVTNRKLDETYTNAIDFYNNKMQRLKDEGVRAYKSEALDNERLLKQRIANLITYNEVQALKKEHKGKRYRWLPSGALNPDPEHQLLYGQIFNVGEGDKDGNMPGERYGCQCGIEWIDD